MEINDAALLEETEAIKQIMEGSNQLKSKTILIVEDEIDVIWSIQDGLTLLEPQLQILQATLGKNALSILAKQIPDLILLDIMMPGMDGWEFASIMKKSKQFQNIPIIFLTGLTDKNTKARAKKFAVDFVDKPFNLKDLYDRVSKALNG